MLRLSVFALVGLLASNSLASTVFAVAGSVEPGSAFSKRASSLERRASASLTVRVTSSGNHCIIAPKNKRTTVGDSESNNPGGMKSFCTKPTSGQGQLPSKFWSSVRHDKKTSKKTGKVYEQITGCIRPSSFDRLVPSDGGGQYDSDGGAGGRGNPAGSVCTGYASYVELLEPDVSGRSSENGAPD